MKCYAGIGSRKTPQHVLNAMRGIAQQLAEQGYVLRSGGADGADTAFEQGAKAGAGEMQIFLPWPGFNGRVANARKDCELWGTFSGVTREALDLAAQFHPNWAACSHGARSLHARNCYQILGPNLDEPVSFVVCWTPRGSGSGGTGQAIRIAKSFSIPVFDLGSDEYQPLKD